MLSVHLVNHHGLDMDKPIKQEAEWVWLRCLAHTLRLEGDYVRAQALERDLTDVFPVTTNLIRNTDSSSRRSTGR